MVNYDKEKNQMIVQGKVYIKELLKIIPNTYDIDKNLILINNNILLMEDSTLIIENGNYELNMDYLVFNTNSSLVIGSDEYELETKSTSVNLNINLIKSNNIGNCYLTIKNSIVKNNIIMVANLLVSVINSSITNNIITNLDIISKNVILKENCMLTSTNKKISYHNLKNINKLEKNVLFTNKYNTDVIFYNSVFENYTTLIENNVENSNIFFKGTVLKNGYDIIENKPINFYHEYNIKGVLLNSLGEVITMSNYDILDKDNNVVSTIITDEYGRFDIWVPYYSYTNKKATYHMPLKIIMDNRNTKSFSVNENKQNLPIVLSNNINKELLLLIERVSNDISNDLEIVKSGLANILYNSENPIKNISATTTKAVDGTRLTISN